MKISIFFSCIAGLIFSTPALAGDKGNGGDALYCDANNLYTLDYAVMRNVPTFQLVNHQTAQESLAAIQKKLDQTLPRLGKSLSNFLQIYYQGGNLAQNVFWIPGIPNDVKDEQLPMDVLGCEKKTHQIVYYISSSAPKSHVRTYYYNKELIAELEKEQNQLSWLLVHEWFRDYVLDTGNLRIINAYFHSKQFLDGKASDVYAMLLSFGLTAEQTGPFYSVTKEQVQLAIDIVNNVAAENNSYSLELSRIKWQLDSHGPTDVDQFSRRITEVNKLRALHNELLASYLLLRKLLLLDKENLEVILAEGGLNDASYVLQAALELKYDASVAHKIRMQHDLTYRFQKNKPDFQLPAITIPNDSKSRLIDPYSKTRKE